MKKKLVILLAVALTVVMLFAACGEKQEPETPAHEHDYGTLIAEVAATCEGTGTKAHYHCSGCNKDFDSDKNEITDLTIPATGHTEVTDAAVAATCTTAGKTEGKHCSVCGKVIVAQQETPIAEHTYGEWIAQTATEKGHYHCSVCGKNFDAEYNELTDLDPSTFNADDETPTITTNADMVAFQEAVNGGNNFAGKTIKLAGDVTLAGAIGTSSTVSFSGNFDGQGHTVTIEQSFSGDPDGVAGLFGYVRTPADGTVTIQNVKVVGTITITGECSNAYCVGGVVSCVDANTEGNGGTVNFINVYSAVDITSNATGLTVYFGGILGFPRHANTVKPITINMDSCVYAGTITVTNSKAVSCGGLLGGTGNAVANRSVALNISNSLVSGSINIPNVSNPDDSGLIVGYPKGSGGNGTVTVSIENCIATGTLNCTGEGWAEMGNKNDFGVAYGEVTGNGNATGTVTNLYYVENTYYDDVKVPVIGVAGADKSTVTNANALTIEAIKALTAETVTMTDATKWNFGTDEEIPAPTSIVEMFGRPEESEQPEEPEEPKKNTFKAKDETPIITTDADMAKFRDEVNYGNNFAGKTIKLAGDVTLAGAIGTGSTVSFSGNFDGQGHTVTIEQSFSGDPDGVAGLFGYVRTPADGTVTIQNVKVVGTITITGECSNAYCVGGVVSCVDANTEGNGGTVNFINVYSAVDITSNATGLTVYFGGILGFPRHANTVKPITINMDSCVYAGTITVTNSKAVSCGGLLGGTGNAVANRSVALNISNSLVSGSINIPNVSNPDDSGLIVGYPKGSGGNGTVTVSIENCIATGTLNCTGEGWAEMGNKNDFGVAYGEVTGNGNATGTVTNLYYVENTYYDDVKVPVIGVAGADKSTVTNANALTIEAIKALTAETVTMTDATKWNFGTDAEIPTPASIVETFGR